MSMLVAMAGATMIALSLLAVFSSSVSSSAPAAECGLVELVVVWRADSMWVEGGGGMVEVDIVSWYEWIRGWVNLDRLLMVVQR
jgi:ATP-dependent protease HslVU (ClpYQ) peptidase subunit